MRTAPTTALFLAAAISCSACAPIPMQVYVAVAPESNIIYSSCVYNTHVPTGVRVSAGDVSANVSLSKYKGNSYVQLRLDIPSGTTLKFDDDVVQITTENPRTSSQAVLPNISLVDTPIVNSYSNMAAIQKLWLPVRAQLVGERLYAGGNGFDKHFWLATYVDTSSATDINIEFPRFSLNGVPTQAIQVRFKSQILVAVALINC